jgi:ATP-dependent Lhr-like helicase
VLWLTPMRALAADTTRALQQPLPDLAPAWTWASAPATRQRRTRAAGPRLPTALVTTPESLSADADARERARRTGRACTPWSSTSGTS